MGVIRVLLLVGLIWAGYRLARRFLGGKGAEQVIPTDRSGVIRKVTYHDNGRMASERYLMDGVMHGPYMLWDHRGNKLAEGEYRNGMLHGTERRFGPDGRQIGVVVWNEGRRTETVKEGADGELISLRLVQQQDEPSPGGTEPRQPARERSDPPDGDDRPS